MTLEEIDKRLQEIPAVLDQIRSEQNQLLGYKQALLDMEDEKIIKDEPKDNGKIKKEKMSA
tara:strand:- start:248 stop:430 length:183 start_codon:yes stop_codon:yes gene_type:complete